MANKLAQVLSADVLGEMLSEFKPVEDLVEQLFMMGVQLSHAVQPRVHNRWQSFFEHHQAAETELAELEGSSDIAPQDVLILRGCPMADEMKKLIVDGELPSDYARIVETYYEQNPGSHAILHPGCIAHQVGRQLIVKKIEIGGKQNLNYYQLACRSGATGRIVCDENGLAKLGMTKAAAEKLVEGFACLYALVRTDDEN